MPPARQPFAYEPIARAASGAGEVTAPKSRFAGPVGALSTGFGETGGSTAAVFGGLSAGSAAREPQTSRSSTHNVIFCFIARDVSLQLVTGLTK